MRLGLTGKVIPLIFKPAYLTHKNSFLLLAVSPRSTFISKSTEMNFLKNAGTAIKSTFTSSGLEKPQYESIKKIEGSEYEERHYSPCKWVSTKAESMKQEDASRKLFFKLFDYIQGKNEKNETIEMTAPVATLIQPGAGPNCKSTFTMSFFIPASHTENPPKPTNPELFIEEWPAKTIFVRQFDGIANEEKWLAQARAHAENMVGKEHFHEEFYYTAGYDSPFKLFGRTNEIWFVKKEEGPTKESPEQTKESPEQTKESPEQTKE